METKTEDAQHAKKTLELLKQLNEQEAIQELRMLMIKFLKAKLMDDRAQSGILINTIVEKEKFLNHFYDENQCFAELLGAWRSLPTNITAFIVDPLHYFGDSYDKNESLNSAVEAMRYFGFTLETLWEAPIPA